MKCSKAREQIILHVYGELSDAEQRKLEQHMRGCSACAEDLAYTRDVLEIIDKADTAEVPEAAWEKCWQEITSGARVQPAPRTGRAFFPRWAPVAAGVILIFAVGLFIGRFWPPSSPTPAAADAAAARTS